MTGSESEAKPDQSKSGPNEEDIAKALCLTKRIDMAKPQQANCHLFRSRVNKIKAQRKSSTSIPITIGQNLESLEIADHILIKHAIARKRSIVLFILLCKRMLFAPFFGHVCFEMHLLQTLVSTISQYADRRVNARF